MSRPDRDSAREIIKKYLSLLLGNGLLEEDPPFFRQTEKGEEFLLMFEVVRASLVVPDGSDRVDVGIVNL